MNNVKFNKRPKNRILIIEQTKRKRVQKINKFKAISLNINKKIIEPEEKIGKN
jgi:hypothetical protein